MNHKDLLDSIVNNMSGPVQDQPETNGKFEGHITFDADTLNIPFITGRVYKIPITAIDWDTLAQQAPQLDASEYKIRSMVNDILTADRSDINKFAEMMQAYNESVDTLLKSFELDPGYNEMDSKVEPYVFTLGKMFDALTLIVALKGHLAIHNIASALFAINDQTAAMNDLSDMNEIDKSSNGLISEDRANFMASIPDDHDVSGLISE